ASAELYDPATGQWTATGSPSTPRGNHVAVRLANGKVLIASGSGDPFNNVLTSAELFDPDTGTWSPAGNLNIARSSPRATLLANGRVLVIAGSGSPTAEVYDPTTNVWTLTGNMSSLRLIFTATLLLDGRVLVAGGNSTSSTLRTAELYDPNTNEWTLTFQLITARQVHSATLLPNGKVLVSGGAPTSSDVPFLTQAELYDPATGQWSATGSMTSARVLHTLSVLPNGKVLAASGTPANAVSRLTSAEVYDPDTGNWTPTAALSVGRSGHTATLLRNGRVLVVAGNGDTGQLTSTEEYESGASIFESVSAASFSAGGRLAPESIVAGFGSGLAASTEVASTVPLPTDLAGVRVQVRDVTGAERVASLFFVSPNQVNYLMPPGTAVGPGIVTVTNGGAIVAGGIVEIAGVAPGIFSANSSGQGFAAAQALRVRSNGTQSYEPVVRFDPALNGFVAVPIELGPATDQVFLILYGTGLRFRSAPGAVTVTIGGIPSEVLFAEAAPGFAGLDQINVRISRSLIGSGENDVAVTVDGNAANLIRINIQ
ncbi:MAG: kelch repeat-containing protein, partial [Acidobacteriota bacterium]